MLLVFNCSDCKTNKTTYYYKQPIRPFMASSHNYPSKLPLLLLSVKVS